MGLHLAGIFVKDGQPLRIERNFPKIVSLLEQIFIKLPDGNAIIEDLAFGGIRIGLEG